jgi:hypothetical protein
LKNNRNSHWNPIGCKRGTLKSEMYLIKLCKGSDGWQPSAYTWQAVERANGSLQKAIQRREQGLMMFGLMMASQAEVTSDFTETTYVHFFLEFLPGTRYSPTKQPLPSTLAPLNECILAILWELRNADPPLSILPKGTLHEFVNLLQAAALFQSINESVSNMMITQAV